MLTQEFLRGGGLRHTFQEISTDREQGRTPTAKPETPDRGSAIGSLCPELRVSSWQKRRWRRALAAPDVNRDLPAGLFRPRPWPHHICRERRGHAPWPIARRQFGLQYGLVEEDRAAW